MGYSEQESKNFQEPRQSTLTTGAGLVLNWHVDIPTPSINANLDNVLHKGHMGGAEMNNWEHQYWIKY